MNKKDSKSDFVPQEGIVDEAVGRCVRPTNGLGDRYEKYKPSVL